MLAQGLPGPELRKELAREAEQPLSTSGGHHLWLAGITCALQCYKAGEGELCGPKGAVTSHGQFLLEVKRIVRVVL